MSEPSPHGERQWITKALGVGSLIGLVIGNLIWIHHFRYGLPFNIDEAGYLQRSLQYAQALDAGSVRALIHHWQTPDIVAPLLPFIAGVVDAIGHLSPWGVLGTQQFFYALTVLAAYLLARTMSTLRWSLLIAATVASLPGLLASGRLFLLAEPATAMFTLTLFLQVRVKTFLRIDNAVLWGVSLGLLTLTRTMVIALLPAFVAVATLRVVGEPRRAVAVRNLLGALSIATILALTWYWTSWHAVLQYLTQFGYGNQANLYTSAHTVTVWGRISARVGNIANQDLFLPLLLAFAAAAILSLPVNRWRAVRRSGHTHVSRLSTVRWANLAKGLVNSGERSTVVIWLICLVILTTSSNSGSYFELTLVPAMVVSFVVALGRSTAWRRMVSGVFIAAASGLTMVDQFGLAPALARYSSVSWSGVSVTAFNDSSADFVGPKLKSLGLGGVYWSNCGGATVTCFYGRTSSITTSYLERWSTLNKEVVRFVYSYSLAHGYGPVVFFAYQGPLLNTNTIGLTAQISGRTLPIGALVPPVFRNQTSLKNQLELPAYGQPNLVLAESKDASGLGADASSDQVRQQVDTLLRRDGFSLVAEFPLPGAPSMDVWWKRR